jgi:hypothetical protein
MAGMLLSACSPLHYTVSNDAFSQLSVDKKMRLFDAENDVSLAQDEKGQMREAIHLLRVDQDAAERASRVADRQENANTPGLKRMWASRVYYLKLAIEYLHRRVDAEDTVVMGARARFELAKALIVKKNKMPGADSIEIKKFEKQADGFGEKSKRELTTLSQLRSKVERARTDWLRQRDDVAANTLGGSGLVGDDEVAVWQSW